ncbi:channel protein, hemolysin III family [Marinitoga piezophila KA3]|uniref:Channel protein, hemolysin III family n=1 Tax=Marinitoga piezophila (strain DSM 14283 / JCM 11233 / KA3) TaxID=443254 RepID=H2J5L3_MARPK|nr:MULTISPECIES: hemolysin III family protein [Marinitoga]AEX84999.1 channel protein, hemolysin III family [Marinitoga piezophila KA3]NUU97159.1 hemolysin D [Marinitoga sp. 1138]
MSTKNTEYKEYTLGEEIANAITHGVGIIFSLVALIILIIFSAKTNNFLKTLSVAIYGSTLLLLYTASTVYHSIQKPRIKKFLKIIDHSSIYLLIAGTYTPFTLVTLNGKIGWTLFITIWSLAIVGIILKIFFVKKFRILSTIFYLMMGWLVVVAIKPLVANLPYGGLMWLVIGGLAYTIGAVFYIWKKLPYGHMIWHLFVLAGSVAHFIAVFFYVLPE